MNERDLTDKLREKYIDGVLGKKKQRTVEEAFQEALDNTTPEHAGAPDATYDELADYDEPEWI